MDLGQTRVNFIRVEGRAQREVVDWMYLIGSDKLPVG